MRGLTIVKMAGVFTVCCVGGPLLVYAVQPDPDELFKRYNPELQKKSLTDREARLQAHNDYVLKIKEYCKSDKPIWVVAAEAEKEDRRMAAEKKRLEREEMERQRREIAEELARKT